MSYLLSFFLDAPIGSAAVGVVGLVLLWARKANPQATQEARSLVVSVSFVATVLSVVSSVLDLAFQMTPGPEGLLFLKVSLFRLGPSLVGATFLGIDSAIGLVQNVVSRKRSIPP